MKRFVILPLLLAALVTTNATANASVPAVSGPLNTPLAGSTLPPLFSQSLQIANQFWGRAPDCTPTPTVVVVAGTDYNGLAQSPGCVIWVNMQRIYAYGLSNGFACVDIVHEYGHLLGYDHSHDPHNVMYGDGLLDYYTVPACDALDRSPLAKHRHRPHRVKKSRPRRRQFLH